ncbi:MAG: carbohydrate-binding protein [Planctomycetaceae bacterium]|nr:carbohydrate-binding protein [Planctomycetaceae bacterium]
MMKPIQLILLLSLIVPVYAELGTGWIQTTYSKRIHLDDEAGLQTFTWSPYQSVGQGTICADYAYDAATDTETFRLFDQRTNRSEIRLVNEYSEGRRQFEGYVTFWAPLNDESLFQIFGYTSGKATLTMMRGYSSYGGSITPTSVGGTRIAENCYGVEKRINIIHDQNDLVLYYVDGVLKARFNESDPATNYWKYGCYGTVYPETVPAVVTWRAVKTYRDGYPPGHNSTPAGAYEAEQAVLSGAVVASSSGGYTGSGYADYVNASGDYVEWTVNADVGGFYDLQFRYALQSGSRPLEIRINGQVASPSMSFAATGDWAAWTYASLPLQMLRAGTNIIRATAIGSNGPNIDHLLVNPLEEEQEALVGHYTFNDGTAADSSGRGNHGTLAGTAAIIDDPVRGKVLWLDGAGGKVDLGNPASLNITGPITVTAWVNGDVAGGGLNRNIVNRGHGGSPTRELTLRLDSGVYYDFGSYESGIGDQQATMPIPVGDIGTNTWIHLAGTWDGSRWNLYRNGVLQNSFNDPVGPLPMTVGWAIGARGGITGLERVLDGRIDDVRIYNAALCAEQIQRIYNGSPVGDIDGNGVINLADLSYLSAQWLGSGTGVPSADIWPVCGGDNAVDMHELLILIEHFLTLE